METAAHALVLLGLVVHQARALERRATPFGSGVWAGVAAAMRPEGVVFAVPVLVSELWRGTDRARLGRFGLGMLCVVVPLLALRRTYYGDWVPNPVHAKASLGLAALAPGLLYVGKLLVSWPVVLGLSGRAAAARRGPGSTSGRAGGAAAVCVSVCIAVQLAVTLAVGGDRFPGQRFLAPVWPLAAVGAVWELERRHGRDWSKARRRLGRVIAVGVIGLVLAARPELLRPLAAALFDLARAQRPLAAHVPRLDAEVRHLGVALLALAGWMAWSRQRSRAGLGPSAALLLAVSLVPAGFDPEVRVCRRSDPAAAYGRRVGEWLRAAMPPGTLVATNAAGALPYFSGLPVVDMLGLTDRHIARRPADRRQWIGHEKGDGAYVLARRPDLIVFGGPEGSVEPWSFPSDREIAAAPEFGRDYELRRVRLRDLEFVYYQRRAAAAAAPEPPRSGSAAGRFQGRRVRRRPLIGPAAAGRDAALRAGAGV
jgi:hypothetical protein